MSKPAAGERDRRHAVTVLIVAVVVLFAAALGAGLLPTHNGTSSRHAVSSAAAQVAWSTAHLPAAVTAIYSVTCPTATVCLAAGTTAAHTVILRSVDAGRTWIEVPAPPVSGGLQMFGGHPASVGCMSATVCVATAQAWPELPSGTGEYSRFVVARSQNAGKTWSTVAASESAPNSLPQRWVVGSVSCPPASAQCYLLENFFTASSQVAVLVSVGATGPPVVEAQHSYEHVGGCGTTCESIGAGHGPPTFTGCQWSSRSTTTYCAVGNGAAMNSLDELTWVLRPGKPTTTITSDPVVVTTSRTVAHLALPADHPPIPPAAPLDLVAALPSQWVRADSPNPCPYRPACIEAEGWVGRTLVAQEGWPTTSRDPAGYAYLRSSNAGKTWSAMPDGSISTAAMPRARYAQYAFGLADIGGVPASLGPSVLTWGAHGWVQHQLPPLVLAQSPSWTAATCAAGHTWIAGALFSPTTGDPDRGILATRPGCGL